jgi:Zn-dependent protease
MHLDLSPDNMRWAVQAMGVLLLSICVHEFGHALLADKLGDDTPRRQGRLTLNPLAHADVIGTLIFPLIGILYAGAPGFGWGKPVQTVPNRYTRKYEMRVGHMFVALAGPSMNLLFGTFLAILHVALLSTHVLPMTMDHPGNKLFAYAVRLNYILFFFNLVPAPPLDGGAVVEGLLPRKYLAGWAKVSVYGPFALMALIMIPQMSRIFSVPADFVTDHVYSLLYSIFPF